MRTHSLVGPSAASRWMRCPASVRLHKAALQHGLVDETSSPYAKRGTYAMAVLELMLSGYSMQTAEEAAGEKPEEFGDEDRDALLLAYGYMDRLRQNADAWGVEAELDILPELNVWGTCDFYAIHGNKAYVVDYKHGVNIHVSAEGNYQLLLYAGGILRRYPRVTEFVLTIVQPRAQKREAVEEARCSAQDVEQFLIKVAETLLFDQTEPVLGEHCRFCPAVLMCPARQREFERIANMTESDLAEPANLVEIIAAEKRVTTLIEAAKRAALKRMLAGAEIAGLTLAEGPGRLSWKDGAVEAL
ncbi:MAG: DUF2800 domain-containing protein, partial [Thermoflexales bacterium]